LTELYKRYKPFAKFLASFGAEKDGKEVARREDWGTSERDRDGGIYFSGEEMGHGELFLI